MEQYISRLTMTGSASVRLLLPVRSGSRMLPFIAPVDAPELPLAISFEGLTLAEQRAALAGFPGGKRFVLHG